MYYKTKPNIIEAKKLTSSNLIEVLAWVGGENVRSSGYDPYDRPFITVVTFGCDMTVRIGDYIIKDNDSNFIPCKSHEFEKHYEEIEEGIK